MLSNAMPCTADTETDKGRTVSAASVGNLGGRCHCRKNAALTASRRPTRQMAQTTHLHPLRGYYAAADTTCRQRSQSGADELATL